MLQLYRPFADQRIVLAWQGAQGVTLSAAAALQQCGSGGVFVSAHRTVSICFKVEISTDALEGACPFRESRHAMLATSVFVSA